MKKVSVIAWSAMFVVASCSSSSTTNTTEPPVTVPITVPMTVPLTVPATVPQTVASLDSCESATEELNDALEVVLDRIDANSLSVADSELLSIFTNLGESLGYACGEARIGEAFSTVILWLSSEAPTRTEAARVEIRGLLSELCPAAEPYGLSVLAQVACADFDSGDDDAGYGVDDFRRNAEGFIESNEVAAQAGTTFTDASCVSPAKIEVGETFSCTAIDSDGVTWEFDLVVTSASAYEITSGAPRG